METTSAAPTIPLTLRYTGKLSDLRYYWIDCDGHFVEVADSYLHSEVLFLCAPEGDYDVRFNFHERAYRLWVHGAVHGACWGRSLTQAQRDALWDYCVANEKKPEDYAPELDESVEASV